MTRRRPRRASAATIGRMPGHRPDLAAQRQLADERRAARRGPDLLRPEQDPERDREVERRAGLALLGRREVDRDPARRVDEAGVPDRAADALASLLERGVGQADDREAGQPAARRRPRPGSPGRRGRRASRTAASQARRDRTRRRSTGGSPAGLAATHQRRREPGAATTSRAAAWAARLGGDRGLLVDRPGRSRAATGPAASRPS